MQVLIAISGFCGFCSRIGNTPCTTPFDFLYVISIHVPAWGTTFIATILSFFYNFNPRSRVGNDGRDAYDDYMTQISIHVPAWGTTRDCMKMKQSSLFQSTFPRGERLRSLLRYSESKLFQSTFPRGERQKLELELDNLLHKFQSTFPRGERP